MLDFDIDNSFTKALPADKDKSKEPHQITDACYSFVDPKKAVKASIVHVSDDVLKMIGLSESDKDLADFLDIFSGNKNIPGSKPYAMAYGGHQFGHWAGQLGDGRAINIGEILVNKKRYSLQLKGAGKTPYSRFADGLAVLRSSVREHLCSEAMHNLNIPTTRSLSLMLTGDKVLRDMLYDGNSAREKGAIVCRVAESFIRFGNFELLAYKGDFKNLKKLIDYSIDYLYPEVKEEENIYLSFFKKVTEKTLEMIIEWQRVGFVHGVMNTDNMSILGLTIDYGPYGFLDNYDIDFTPNTTDRENRRYRFSNQGRVGLWNLLQFANALVSIVNDNKALESVLESYESNYKLRITEMMAKKLGFFEPSLIDEGFLEVLQGILQESNIDMTIFFRNLSGFNHIKEDINNDFIKGFLNDALYEPHIINGLILERWVLWFSDYKDRLIKSGIKIDDKKELMNKNNPKYILRNYMAQMAIDAADNFDYTIIEEIYDLLKKPYDEQEHGERWFQKRPDWAKTKPGCSMLSCSS